MPGSVWLPTCFQKTGDKKGTEGAGTKCTLHRLILVSQFLKVCCTPSRLSSYEFISRLTYSYAHNLRIQSLLYATKAGCQAFNSWIFRDIEEPKHALCRVWWCQPLISALERQRLEDHSKLEATLVSILNLGQSYAPRSHLRNIPRHNGPLAAQIGVDVHLHTFTALLMCRWVFIKTLLISCKRLYYFIHPNHSISISDKHMEGCFQSFSTLNMKQ